jgi:hypothetical protein
MKATKYLLCLLLISSFSYLQSAKAGNLLRSQCTIEEPVEEAVEEAVVKISSSEKPNVTLVGFASFPADSFGPGPSSGNFITGNTNNVTLPFPSQPIQGFSAVQVAATDDEKTFWFLSDNGYGKKSNSQDFLLRLYRVKPFFRRGGADDGGVDVSNQNGTVEILEFIQLSDPNKKIPFKIIHENTSERFLTGADLDIESFVIDEDGSFWIGDEFGPFILHFDAKGKLLDAPFATPNYFFSKWKTKTFKGQAPIVIGHRGASGELPEHTLGSYKRAMEQGADFIEPDLVVTKDGILICRHEPNIITTTDVASHPEFQDRRTIKMVDGKEEEGFFVSDFTLEEIKTLRAIMPQAFRPQVFNGLYQIPTLTEVIELVKQFEANTGRQVGIYPEIKHATYHTQMGLPMEQVLVNTLERNQFTDPKRIFIQSFEVSNLKKLHEMTTNFPLILLMDASSLQLDGSLVETQPYDFIVKEEKENRTYGDLRTPEGLKEIASFVSGIGVWKRMIRSVKSMDTNGDGQADDVNGDGLVNDADKTLLTKPSTLIQDAHEAGLLVHVYTMRNEQQFLAADYQGDPSAELVDFIELGIDGFFTDFPLTGKLIRDQMLQEFVISPDHPSIKSSSSSFTTLNGKAPVVIGTSPPSSSPHDTLMLYKLAIADGVDFIQSNLMMTKDGQLLVSSHPTGNIVIEDDNGYRYGYSEKNNALTLEEIIDFLKQVEFETGRQIGLCLQINHHPRNSTISIFNVGEKMIQEMIQLNFTDRIWLQSFEIENLKAFKDKIMPAASVNFPLILQMIDNDKEEEEEEEEKEKEKDLSKIATYANAIEVNKRVILNDMTKAKSTLIQDAHAVGLQVHAYNTYIEKNEEYQQQYPILEDEQLIQMGIDAIVTVFPGTTKLVLSQMTRSGDGIGIGGNDDDPFVLPLVNLERSHGFEGLAMSMDKKKIYPLLEGTVFGDPINSLRLYEFEIQSKQFTNNLIGFYRKEKSNHNIGDFTIINENEFLVIERDNEEASKAQFKKMYKIHFLHQDLNGFLEKTLVVDFLSIQDPKDLNRDGLTLFTFPFMTIESIVVLDQDIIFVANDNNYPFSMGRPPNIDHTEFILLKLPERLNFSKRSSTTPYKTSIKQTNVPVVVVQAAKC